MYAAHRAMSIHSHERVEKVIACILLLFYIGSVQIKWILFSYYHTVYKIFINMICAFANSLLFDTGGGNEPLETGSRVIWCNVI